MWHTKKHGRDWAFVSVTESLLDMEGWLPDGIPHRKEKKLGTGSLWNVLNPPKMSMPTFLWSDQSRPYNSGRASLETESSLDTISGPISVPRLIICCVMEHWSTSLMGKCVLLPGTSRNSFKSFQLRIKQSYCGASSLLTSHNLIKGLCT